MNQWQRFEGVNVASPENRALARADRGQGMLEYALIIVFVMIVVFTSLMLFGPTLTKLFDTVNSAL